MRDRPGAARLRRPSRATTALALARIPATDPEHRIGTVFVNPGGPGGSGVDLVLDGFGEFLRDNLDGRFDVVGFDPRGIGASDPLHCFDSEEDLAAFLAAVPLFPYVRARTARSTTTSPRSPAGA